MKFPINVRNVILKNIYIYRIKSLVKMKRVNPMRSGIFKISFVGQTISEQIFIHRMRISSAFLIFLSAGTHGQEEVLPWSEKLGGCGRKTSWKCKVRTREYSD